MLSNEIQVVSYNLPTCSEPSKFGPEFWKAFHDLASKIPCSDCRPEAESFVRFWHDLKNYDLGKPIYDRSNFNMWMKKLSSTNCSRRFDTELKIILGFIAITIVTVLIAVLTRK